MFVRCVFIECNMLSILLLVVYLYILYIWCLYLYIIYNRAFCFGGYSGDLVDVPWKDHIDPRWMPALQVLKMVFLRTFPYLRTFQAIMYRFSVQSGPIPDHFRPISAILQHLKLSFVCCYLMYTEKPSHIAY